MKLTEDDRYIRDRYEVGYDGYANEWLWWCPDRCDGGDSEELGQVLLTEADAIKAAREHDEESHRGPEKVTADA